MRKTNLFVAFLAMSMGFTLTGCDALAEFDIESLTHSVLKNHTWSGWQSDENEHWKACEGCDETIEREPHTFTEYEVDVEPTCTEDGKKHKTCTVCGYVFETNIPALGHDIDEEWSSDEENHWHTCTECDEIFEHEAHRFDNWIVDVEATCTEDGHMHRDCVVCGYSETKLIEAGGHEYSETPDLVELAEDKHSGNEIYYCLHCGEAKIVPFEVEDVFMYPSEGLDYDINQENSGYDVVGIGECTDKVIVIPEVHEELPVTGIGEGAFEHNSFIETVHIPNTVESIGDRAFADCEALNEVSLPDDVEFGLDVFRESINVETNYRHNLIYVPAKEATCEEEGCIEHYYCEDCHECFADAQGTVRLYDTSIPPAHEFVDGVCQHCGKVQSELLIVSVDNVPNLGKFPLGTMEDAIGLPPSIFVKTADGVKHELPLVWDLSTYNKSQVGDYVINGYIQASGYYFDEGLTNVVSTNITITDLLDGTADIVFVLDISGSMGDEIASVKNNIINLSVGIENEGISARWAVITFSDYTITSGYTTKEETQCVMNGASTWFTSAEECRQGIASVQIAYGGDEPEADVDGLMFAHETLTTRRDARVFYILLTDATYKVDNHYGLESMDEMVDILVEDSINTSVICTSSHRSLYESLWTRTGGIYCNITENFASSLLQYLIPIIRESVDYPNSR